MLPLWRLFFYFKIKLYLVLIVLKGTSLGHKSEQNCEQYFFLVVHGYT